MTGSSLPSDERKEIRDLLRELRLSMLYTQKETKDDLREVRFKIDEAQKVNSFKIDEAQKVNRDALNKLDINMNKLTLRIEILESWSFKKWIIAISNAVYIRPK